MTTSRDTEERQTGDSGFGRREISAAERELQEVLAAARALGIETETAPEETEIDTTAAEALVELGLDRPVEEEATPIASFLQGDDAEDEAAEPAISLEGIQETNAAWFAINTYTGHESRVRDALDLRIRNMDAEDQFVELLPEQAGAPKKGMADKRFVLVPTQQEVEIRGGKRREVERKLLPGYVLLQIRLDRDTGQLSDQSWHVVNGTAGVTGFVGTREDLRDRAIPLPPAQVAKIIGQTQVEEPRVRVGFSVNDSVRLTDGPFLDMVAEVEEINVEKGKVRVRISMFGRETPLELDFDQVEKQ
ncbi:MAG: transcription termination/antitermination protein NusG [Chloroflexi bacterium]|nr:transcription termination/antitermination protein NusG [Chloroflexota bacterium]MYJ58066.1 transcription termination/antitermination protein NusG [Chloroflexota bacterium]